MEFLIKYFLIFKVTENVEFFSFFSYSRFIKILTCTKKVKIFSDNVARKCVADDNFFGQSHLKEGGGQDIIIANLSL
jgi:hypothetical protein